MVSFFVAGKEVGMAVEKKLLYFLCVSLFASLPAADWKGQTAAQIGLEKEYPSLVQSLQKVFPDLPENEKAAVRLLIGYCQSRLNDPRAELLWMKKYLEEFKAADVALGFIPAGPRTKIMRFKGSWQKDFPVLRELELDAKSSRIAFFKPPGELKLRVRMSIPCSFQLFSADGNLLAKGIFGSEPRVVAFPVAADFFKEARHDLRLLLTLVSAPEKEIEKYFAVELDYRSPEGMTFDPLTAEVKMNGRELQAESRTETVVLSRRTVFDKKEFKKSFLKDLLIGAAFFVLRATFISSSIDNPDTSLYAKSALYGTRKVFALGGIAFSLKALLQLPKVFKHEGVSEERTVDLPEMKAANAILKRELDLGKEKVMVQLTVKLNEERGRSDE
jgi:hypothetical protein